MFQNLFPVFEIFADFQEIAVGEIPERNLQYVAAVFSGKILPFPLDGPILERLEIEPVPKLRATREYNLACQTKYADEEVSVLTGLLIIRYRLLDSGNSPFLAEG